MLKKFILPFLFVYILIFQSCADDPSSVGLNLLEQDFLKIDTVNSVDQNLTQSSSYFKKVVSLGNSSRLLVGSRENLAAHTLMNFAFFLPDSIKSDYQDGSLIIESATIEMFPNYLFSSSDSLANFDFSVHEISSFWSSSSFTADSFSVLQFNSEDLSSEKEFNDSVYSFRISNQIVSKWFDFTLNPDSLTNYGILISPSASTQKIVGFNAFDPLTDTATKLSIVVSKQGAYSYTIYGFIASDISVLLGDLPSAGTDYMIVQSSLTANAKLFFDLTSIPPNVVINRATLIIKSDSTKNLVGSTFENSLIAFLISNNETNEVNNELFIRLSSEGNNFTGDITPMIRKWLRDGDNYGMLLRTGSELIGTELFYLFGSDATDLSKRPYLEIVYSYN